MKIGDTVKLASGSFAMTVESIEGETAYCVWMFDAKIFRDNFPIKALVLYK